MKASRLALVSAPLSGALGLLASPNIELVTGSTMGDVPQTVILRRGLALALAAVASRHKKAIMRAADTFSFHYGLCGRFFKSQFSQPRLTVGMTA